MRRIILLFIAVFAINNVNAQTDHVVFGIKGGVQFTNFEGDFVNTGGTATGLFLGGLVDFHITPKFHVQTELLYSQEGSDSENGGIDYIRIPVLAKFYVTRGFTLHAGPQLAFKVGGDDFIDENTTSTDFGLGLGAGYEFPGGFMFDARYNLGLSNISSVDGAEAKNTGIMLGVGYRF